ncbi:hypothetical protein [Paraburkholderia sp. SOS3]|uniref:hypothetical protein n=1 Tax=Paraburkholderia sp. SOS3 TaxID=1926494 RepID=UPI0012EC1030|nr:hypothetical protein [Paraburkholderia sp. SOS3]
MSSDSELHALTAAAREAAINPQQIAARYALAKFTAKTFEQVGEELQSVGYIFGGDRVSGKSPFGHGSDEIVAVSLLFRIAGQLTSSSADLFADGRHYAAAALLRQIVEIEYLAWAFESRDNDAERWLRSSADERRDFFAPAKLRQAANGKFRGKDYWYHCELGGHPVPNSSLLLRRSEVTCQFLLSDLLGHTGRIWDHFLDWSAGNEWAIPVHRQRQGMYEKYDAWKKVDELLRLPPPP